MNATFLRKVGLFGMVLCYGLMLGCAMNPPVPNDPRYAPVAPIIPKPNVQSLGSIYASGTGVALWEDKRARRVGDIVTVILAEKTSTTKSSKTAITKEDDNAMSVTALLGTTPTTLLPGFIGSSTPLTPNTTTSNKREFEGDASADQSNQLNGSITVTVVDVVGNGNLVVRGEKWMTFSEGDEFIRIEGIVRSADVNPDNTVLSTRLADARITYSGRGQLANAQRQGWLTEFFTSPLWPF
ncbi:flagellar basal body L-ring protein [Gammaproteobacteria bacterium 45_16_T64]|mgnify:CR=1 FL=1|nr:flagellar basal body L-ring protein [Gammaproteobacteria bacterium 45_16_T64]